MFDSHAHVAFGHFDKDRSEVIERARQAGLLGWLETGTDVDQSKRAIALAEKEEGVFATVGVHPTDIGSLTEESWGEIRQLLQHPQVKAIGEIGLDLYHSGDLEQQQGVLSTFMRLSQEFRLPIVFHVRSGEGIDAHDELLYVLSRFRPSDRPRGMVHTYSGTVEQARRYLEFGMYISFSGVITFNNAGSVLEAAKWAPLDRILVETDCPFLAPAPYRGKRNEPAYVRAVAEKLAEIKGVPADEVMKQTEKNARELLQV